VSAERVDDFARASVGMSRRRAIGLISGVLFAGTALRPRAARAAGITCPPGMQKCEVSGGAAVCVPPDWPCCNSITCAGACTGSWKVCSSPGTQAASCDDSPRICTDPKGPYAGQRKINFCSIGIAVAGGICGDAHVKNVGWCCGPGSECGGDVNQCICKAGRVTCGDNCCGDGEYCDTSVFSEDLCAKLCPDHRQKCNGDCCTGQQTCGIGGCSCTSPLVECGPGLCCSPKKDPGSPNPRWNPVGNMLNMMGASSATHGGQARDTAVFAAASNPAGVDAALRVLAAVDGQGAAAMLAIRNGKRDPNFRHRVTVARAKPPAVAADATLDAGSAAAINKLLAAEARAYALIAAMAKALWRERSAYARHDLAAAKSQLRASAKFAGQSVTALKRIQALRTAAAKALIAGAAPEVFASDSAVAAFIASVKSSGIPTSLRGPMSKLGVGSADLKRLRAGVLDQTVTSASGPVLIAPLQDQARASELKQLISELSKFSARARRHPIAR
jgi:hypothetical protein